MSSKRFSSPKLAVNGGNAVRKKQWPRGPQHFPEELELLKQVLNGPALPLARGQQSLAMRESLKELYHGREVVACSSGTTALHIALAVAGIGPGDEVIVSPCTDYGSVIGILQLNAIPVFADIIDGGLAMDPKSVESRITKHTRAILPIHIMGYPADMKAIMALAKAHDLKVIEDCAQSHLTRIGSKYVGCFGDFGAFSTNDSKHIKSSEGGFVVCRRKGDARQAELFSDKCYNREPRGVRNPAFPALNARMSEVNAAIVNAQLPMLEGWVNERNRIGRALEAVIADYPLTPCVRPKNAFCSYWQFIMTVDNDADFTGVELGDLLRSEGIPCRVAPQPFLVNFPIFKALNDNPKAFPTYVPGRLRKGAFKPERCPNACNTERILAIPMDQYTTDKEVRDVQRALKKILG